MEVPREVADLTVAACSSGLAIHRDVPFQRILGAVEVRVFIAQLIRGPGPVHSRTVINNPDARLYRNHWAPPTLANAKTVTYERWRSQLKSRCRVGDQGTREPSVHAGQPESRLRWSVGTVVPSSRCVR